MSLINCPNCHHQIALTVVDTGKTKKRPPGAAAVNDQTLERVYDFMRTIEPGDWTSADLYEQYRLWAVERGHTPLQLPAFSRSIKLNGGERWRSAKARGFRIHPKTIGKAPAQLDEATKRRHEAAVQREALAESNVRDAVAAAKTRLTPQGWL